MIVFQVALLVIFFCIRDKKLHQAYWLVADFLFWFLRLQQKMNEPGVLGSFMPELYLMLLMLAIMVYSYFKNKKTLQN